VKSVEVQPLITVADAHIRRSPSRESDKGGEDSGRKESSYGRDRVSAFDSFITSKCNMYLLYNCRVHLVEVLIVRTGDNRRRNRP
jgi:hypothetical protein